LPKVWSIGKPQKAAAKGRGDVTQGSVFGGIPGDGKLLKRKVPCDKKRQNSVGSSGGVRSIFRMG